MALGGFYHTSERHSGQRTSRAAIEGGKGEEMNVLKERKRISGVNGSLSFTAVSL